MNEIFSLKSIFRDYSRCGREKYIIGGEPRYRWCELHDKTELRKKYEMVEDIILRVKHQIDSERFFEDISSKFPVPSVELRCSHLENQEKCLVEEIGLNQNEARIISKAIRELAVCKINEAKKEWSTDAKDAFVNLMTAILIQEVKAVPAQELRRKTKVDLGYG